MQPADLANRALDAIGVRLTIGDLQEGSDQSKVALRHYGPCMRQLFRGANWNFARKREQLVLLNDASGNTTREQMNAGIPVTVGPGTPGMRPWVYEYKWPVDCVKARFVPMTLHGSGPSAPAGNIALPPNPLMSGLNSDYGHRQVPARFLVTQDAVPNVVGVASAWTDIPDTSQTMGQGITSQTVILTNQPHASLVFTALITYPDQWDPLFQEAFVALLACHLALPLIDDRRVAVSVRDEQIKIAKMALDQARISDGNEGVTSADNNPDWLRIRNTGGWGWRGEGDGAGVLSYGWDSVSFGNGSTY